MEWSPASARAFPAFTATSKDWARPLQARSASPAVGFEGQVQLEARMPAEWVDAQEGTDASQPVVDTGSMQVQVLGDLSHGPVLVVQHLEHGQQLPVTVEFSEFTEER